MARENLNPLAIRLASRVLRRARKEPSLRKLLPTRGWTLEVEVVTSTQMKRLNTKYRGKKYATDVLSFSAPEIFRKNGYLGELVLCDSVLVRQAKEHHHSVDAELEVLIAHGLLHLLGFDHEKGEAAARKMARWEARLLFNSGLIARSLSSKVTP